MSENRNRYDKPLTKREVTIKTASLGPVTRHGDMPPTDLQLRKSASLNAISENGGAGTREHGQKPNAKKPNYPLRRRVAAGLIATGVVVPAGNALVAGSNDQSEPIEPVPTVVVGAQGDGVWGAAERELIDSGHVREDGTVSQSEVRKLHDEAMMLNLQANPNFDALHLQPGQDIIVPDVNDIPDK